MLLDTDLKYLSCVFRKIGSKIKISPENKNIYMNQMETLALNNVIEEIKHAIIRYLSKIQQIRPSLRGN